MPSSQGRKTCNVNDLLDVSQRDGTQLLWTILGMISFPHSKFYSLVNHELISSAQNKTHKLDLKLKYARETLFVELGGVFQPHIDSKYYSRPIRLDGQFVDIWL